ncbi:hypothetical protein GCM10010399_84310 [Dactylosporangium fulvum]
MTTVAGGAWRLSDSCKTVSLDMGCAPLRRTAAVTLRVNRCAQQRFQNVTGVMMVRRYWLCAHGRKTAIPEAGRAMRRPARWPDRYPGVLT